MTQPKTETTPIGKKLKFIEMSAEAAHALKELRIHAPNHVRIILKYIHALEGKAKP